jgi:hypothetical protein
MNKKELKLKLEGILGENKELHILKGKMINLQLVTTKDGKGSFYAFDLICVKKFSEDEYGQSFNKYHMVMPVELSKEYKQEDMAGMKNNEVLVVVNTNSQVKVINREGLDPIKVNNISLYVIDIFKTKEICKAVANKVVNI